ncbi:dsRBD fold-containing protein [Actinacidiphila sp. bgisy160]|uniref:dsRBD fold-containing protein n=1 Tax=Actinacidiphila sp. bgisy160 TaxID=3413796 RepID=UPI003D731F27
MEAKQWSVQIYITEHGDETHARAVLTTRDTSNVAGTGVARRTSADAVPEIGDELAAGRALEDLGRRVQAAAADDARGGSAQWQARQGATAEGG